VIAIVARLAESIPDAFAAAASDIEGFDAPLQEQLVDLVTSRAGRCRADLPV